MAKFRLGLVGAGRMGQMHLRALSKSEKVEVVSVVEPLAATASKLKSMGLETYDSYGQMFNKIKFDGVLIAAPTDKHLEVITEIAQSKVPILSEKPCGLNPSQAIKAGKIADENGVRLQVAYWRRFVLELRALEKKIKSGEAGQVHFINATQWDEIPPRKESRLASGGIFIDMAVHEIDQIRWLTKQEVKKSKTLIFPQDEDSIGDTDSTESILEMSGGAIGLVSLGRFHPGGDLVSTEVFTNKLHERVIVLNPESGEEPQLAALRLQAESFADWVYGGPQEGATTADAVVALEVASQLKTNAGLK